MAKKVKDSRLFIKHIVRKLFLEDWGLKLLALFITLALWFGVTGLSTPTTKRLTVALNLSTAAGAQIVNTVPADIEIEISGDKRKIDPIRSSDLGATVDLSETKEGNWVVSLSPDTVFVPLPQGVKLTDVAPTRIAVNLEDVEQKEVEVRLVTKGSPAAGYEIYSMSAIPARILVRGPVSAVRKLEYVRTADIDIAGRREDFVVKQVPVTAPDPKAAVLDTVVDVQFQIGEKRTERTFSVPFESADGTTQTATVTLYGPRSLLTKLRSTDLRLDTTDPEAPQPILPTDLQNQIEVRKISVK